MQTANDTRNSVKEEPIEGDQRLRRSRAEQQRRRRRAQPAAGEDCGGDQAAGGGGAVFDLRRRVVLASGSAAISKKAAMAKQDRGSASRTEQAARRTKAPLSRGPSSSGGRCARMAAMTCMPRTQSGSGDRSG
ncbi:hypothetical protein Scep_010466 [Stephania cephalantha]|uniref:Uncharacterized protein n=1 Tax=Stephania cephalantha TaxID=152367 RepID=A0AAP0PH35_9MAGN